MAKYTMTTIGTETPLAPTPLTMELHADSDAAARAKVAEHYRGAYTLTRECTVQCGGPHGGSPDDIEERLWRIAEGVGERDSIDTYVMLIELVRDLQVAHKGENQS
jgi:hypothetical protein